MIDRTPIAVFVLAAAALLGVASFSLPVEQSTADGGNLQRGDQPPYARTPWGGDRIQLRNASDAVDPEWEQLAAFLKADRTDQKHYDPVSFPCGAFAEELHNNAEAAGIKAAWVVVEFEGDGPRHALNAFLTTDRGLVWIDSTDLGLGTCPLKNRLARGEESTMDKIAYLVPGEKYRSDCLDTLLQSLQPERDGLCPDGGPWGTVRSIETYW